MPSSYPPSPFAATAEARPAAPPDRPPGRRRRTTLAGRLAVAGVLAQPLAPAWAQAGEAAQGTRSAQETRAAQPHDWELPAASLEASLKRVAHQAGLTLATDPALTEGRPPRR